MRHNFSKNFLKNAPLQPKQDPPKMGIEGRAEEFLNFPQEKARARTDAYLNVPGREQNSTPYGDAARHYLAGDETARAIQDKFGFFKNTGLAKIAGFIGSNAGGLIHEAKNIQSGRPFMESVEDATNNLAGSLASVFSRKTSEKILDLYKKIAPDGKVKN